MKSLLGLRGNNGYAKTPDLFRSAEITYRLLHLFRFSAKWLELFFSPLRCFHPIPNHGLPILGFAITLFGHTILGMAPLDEWSARRRDLTARNTHNRQTFMGPAGFEPTIAGSERTQIPALRTINIRTHHDVTLYVHFIASLKCKMYTATDIILPTFYMETLNFLCVWVDWAYWANSELTPLTAVDIVSIFQVLVKVSGFTFFSVTV